MKTSTGTGSGSALEELKRRSPQRGTEPAANTPGKAAAPQPDGPRRRHDKPDNIPHREK